MATASENARKVLNSIKAKLNLDKFPRGTFIEGNGSEPCPRDLRLQFFETQEQCKSLKQELNPMNPLT